MTKQQPSGTNLLPSKICRILLGLLCLKLLILGFLFFDPSSREKDTGLQAFVSGFFAASSPAEAATSDAAAAPPPVQTVLPGVNPTTAPSASSGSGLPSVSSPVSSDNMTESVLPPINQVPAPPHSVNGTTDNTLSLERENLARRQENLARKEQELRVLDGELGRKLEEMQMLENRIGQMMKDAENKQDAKFKHLVDVLSNMKAKQAASVLETLDSKIAVKVLAGMRGRQAGEILTFVKPEKAAQLTESLARMQMPLD